MYSCPRRLVAQEFPCHRISFEGASGDPDSFDLVPRDGASNLDSLVSALADTMEQRLLFRWQELTVTEAVVEQIGAEFGGEDPLKPASRAGLQNAKEIAEKLSVELGALGRSVDLPIEAPNEEVLDLRAMLERKGCVFRATSTPRLLAHMRHDQLIVFCEFSVRSNER